MAMRYDTATPGRHEPGRRGDERTPGEEDRPRVMGTVSFSSPRFVLARASISQPPRRLDASSRPPKRHHCCTAALDAGDGHQRSSMSPTFDIDYR